MKNNLKIIQAEDLPGNFDAGSVYELLPKSFSQSFYDERTDRNIDWITREEQEMLRNSVVGIAGCGGMGGLVAATLLRLGVGGIRIADCETFEVSNLNRQFAANKKTIGQSKAFATARMLREISDDTKIVVYPEGITEETVEHFVTGCDIIADEIEFWAVGARILLHRTMRAKGGMILNSPTVGHRVYVTKFTPDSMTIEEVLGMDYTEAKELQLKIQTKQAIDEEIRKVMEAMLNFAAPEIPEYSVDPEKYSMALKVKERLLNQIRASIIATNPPMASGFLANQVLFHLLEKKFTIRRNFVIPPMMPGYLMFDAGLLTCQQCNKKWSLGHEKNTPITITTSKSNAEKKRVTAIIQAKYLKLFGTTPDEAELYIIGQIGEKIMGTIGFELPDENNYLSIPAGYDYDSQDIHPNMTVNNIAQSNRWTSEDSDLGLALVYAVCLYAKKFGKDYLWIEQTPGAHRILTRSGMKFHEIISARVAPERIHPKDRPYYIKHKPLPYIMVASQIINAVSEKMKNLERAGKIVFDVNVF